MDELRAAVLEIFDARFNGTPPRGQVRGTAFAIALTQALSTTDSHGAVLFGRPHRNVHSILTDWGLTYEPEEYMVDFSVINSPLPSRITPLVGCESEMYSGHGVNYSFEREGDYRANGYVFDFRKLLMFRAPTLLFVAMHVPDRIARLEVTLDQCARDYIAEWQGRRLRVVLLPASKWNKYSVRVGVEDGDGLRFDDLIPQVI
jgi:hypothetical protein